MAKGYKHWTDKEKEYLKNNWGVTVPALIAKELDRSKASIQRKATTMGLIISDEQYETVTGKTRWTTEMKDYLIENYSKLNIKDIMEHLQIFNEKKIRRQASYLGITEEYHEWSDEEEECLKTYWGERSIANIGKRLKLSEEAVRQKAYQLRLGNQLYASGNFYALPIIADMLGLGKRTIYGWVNSGKLECKKLSVGKSFRYLVKYECLLEFLENNQSMYNTKYCDLGLITSLFSSYTLLSGDRIEVRDIPHWLQNKIDSDNKTEDKIIPKEWTTKEELRLKEYHEDGKLTREISELMERTQDSIRGKLRLIKMGCESQNQSFMNT